MQLRDELVENERAASDPLVFDNDSAGAFGKTCIVIAAAKSPRVVNVS